MEEQEKDNRGFSIFMGTADGDGKLLGIEFDIELMANAVEVRFTAPVGQSYQCQYSHNLESWEPVSETITGDDAVHSALMSLEGRNKNIAFFDSSQLAHLLKIENSV